MLMYSRNQNNTVIILQLTINLRKRRKDLRISMLGSYSQLCHLIGNLGKSFNFSEFLTDKSYCENQIIYMKALKFIQ